MTTDKCEGVLRTITTLDGKRFKLEYTARYGYHVTSGMSLWARGLSLETGLAMVEAMSLAHSDDAEAVIRHAKTEAKRLEFAHFDTPASRQWAIINGALNRLEGLRPVIRGRRGQVVEWVRVTPKCLPSAEESAAIMAANARRRTEAAWATVIYDRSVRLDGRS